jgi:hypothetical protein
VDSLIPLLYVEHGHNAQAAVNDATAILEAAVVRFEKAANTLLEDKTNDRLTIPGITSFLDSCRYACTANLRWR